MAVTIYTSKLLLPCACAHIRAFVILLPLLQVILAFLLSSCISITIQVSFLVYFHFLFKA